MLRRAGFAALGAGAVTAALVAMPSGCKEPTQVSVTLRAGAGVCDAGGSAADKRTDIFVGSPGPRAAGAGLGEPRANVVGCPGENLGSFTLVPSGRDGDVLVEVAMALAKGKSPAACGADPKDCILARRRVAFAKNQPLKMTIRLDLECVGVSCDPESTCFGGRCRPIETTCSDSECELTPGDGGVAPDAAADGAPSTDAGADVRLDDAGTCPMPATSEAPVHIAASGGALFFIDGGGKKVFKMAPSGAVTDIGEVLPAGANLSLLTVGGGRAMVATPNVLYATAPLTPLATESAPLSALAMLDTTNLPVPYAYLTPAGFFVSAKPGVVSSAVKPTRLVASGDHFFVVDDTTLRKYEPTGLLAGTVVLDTAPSAIAPAPGGKLYYATPPSLFVGDVTGSFPPPAASLPVSTAVVAMTSSGETWAGIGDLLAAGTWAFNVLAAKLAGASWSGTTPIAEVRGGGPTPVKREIAIAGSCVYYLIGEAFGVARHPF